MLRPKLKFKSIGTKLMVAQVLATTALMGIIMFITYNVSIRVLINDTMKLDNELVSATSKSFDKMVTSFRLMFNYVTMDEEVQRLLKMPYSSTNDLDFHMSNSEINSRVLTQTIFVDEIHSLYLYDDNENLRISFKRRYKLGEPDIVYKELTPNEFSDFGNVTIQEKEGFIFFKRKILDINSHEGIGYLIVVYDKNSIKNQLDAISPNKLRFLMLLDEANALIEHSYTSNDEVAEVVKHIDLTQKSYVDNLSVIGKAVINISESYVTGWKIVSVTAVSELAKGAEIISRSVLIAVIIGTVLSLALSSIISERFSRAIIKLTKLVDKIESENLNVHFDYESDDEIAKLGQSFNNMMDRVNYLINEVYREEIKRRDAQLQALQSQLNPHFLYNTLDCINWLAKLGRAEEINTITLSLAKIMKASAKPQKEISVTEELEYVKDFLAIYKISLQDKLRYAVTLDSEAAQIPIPCLLLQPLIENAVKHGIKKRPQGGSISVECRLQEDVVFSIIDDGMGIEPEKLQEIREYIASPDLKDRLVSIGIRNVVDRLRIFYGQRAEFNIESQPNIGTIIEIRIKDHEKKA